MKESEEIATKRAGDDNRNGKFGYFGCTPFFLQWLNNPGVFLILVILAMIGNSKYEVETVFSGVKSVNSKNVSGKISEFQEC